MNLYHMTTHSLSVKNISFTQNLACAVTSFCSAKHQLQLRVDVVDGQQGEGAQVARPWSLLPALTRVSVRPLVLAELGEGADVGGPGGESHAHGLASRHEVRAPPVRVLLHSALHRENINIEIYIQAKCNKLLAKKRF